MTIFTGSPGQSGDDGYEKSNNNDVNISAPNVRNDFSTENAYYTFIRFPNVTIPQGATINSAKITFTLLNDDIYCDVHCEDVDNSATLADVFNEITDKPKTTASVTFASTGVGTPWDMTGLASPVQEVIDRAGWASGNGLGFILVRNASADMRFRGYDNGSGYPVIEIDYTEAVSGIPIPVVIYNYRKLRVGTI